MDSFPEQFTALQRDFLATFFAQEPRFCLIGGGALAYYLPKRGARDLDLVGPAEVNLRDQVATLREVARRIGAQISFPERSSDLLRCGVRRAGEHLQVDLGTRTAQIRVGEKNRFGAIRVDSLLTLATHKLLALCFRSRPRDLEDFCALLDTGLLLAEVVDETVRREPALDPAAIHTALLSWSSKIAPEDQERLSDLQPLRQALIHRLRALCFDIANHRALKGAFSLRSFSPLQGDVLQALFRRHRHFCLTGSAALSFYSSRPPPDDLVLWSPPGVELASAAHALEQAADACGGQTHVMRADSEHITVRIHRDTEVCLVDVMLTRYQNRLPSPHLFGELVVDSPRALVAGSLVALWRQRKGADLLLLKTALALGVSVKQGVYDALASERAADLPGLAWAITTLRSLDDSSAELFSDASPFRQGLLREVRRLAYEEACSQPMATVHAAMTRDGAQPVSGRRPILYLMGGGFGAGKSTLAALLANQGQIPSAHIVRVEPDEIMAGLPRYQRILRDGKLREAAALHSESNAIVKEILDQALDMNTDIFYDAALTNPDKSLQQLQAFKDAGYEIHLFGVTVDPLIAIARVAKRAAKTGRPDIPVEDLLASHRGFGQGFPAYVDVSTYVRLYDRSGEEPTLLASRDAQAGDELAPLRIHDAVGFERFRARAELDLPACNPRGGNRGQGAVAVMADVLIGNEFTFTDEAMAKVVEGSLQQAEIKKEMAEPYAAALRRWRSAMEQRGIKAQDGEYAGHPSLLYKFAGLGWKYEVTRDQGCVEVITAPVAVRDLYEGGLAAALDDYIFAVAKEAGLAAHAAIGSGHINIDRASAFGEDPEALLNFILACYEDSDYWKQEDGHHASAPFLEEHLPSQRAKFEDMIKRFRADKEGPLPWSIDRLADELVNVFDENLVGKSARQSPHYQALNFEHLNEEMQGERRLEVRRVPAQRDREHLLQHLNRLGILLAAAKATPA